MSIEAYDVKRLRGYIATGLQAFYPNGISGLLIHRDILAPVFPHLEWRQVLQQLDYLMERGFVEAVEMVRLATKRSGRNCVYRLTATGLDVASGVVEDAAIEAEV